MHIAKPAIAICWTAVLALLAAASATAHAQKTHEDPSRINPPGLSAGIGVADGQSLYEDADDTETLTVPFLGYEGERFYLRGVTAGARIWQGQDLQLDLVAQPRFDQLDPDDSEALSGMERRKRSLDGGLRAGWRAGPWRISGRAVTDLLDRHQGQEIKLDLGYQVGPPFLFVRPRLSLSWQSERLTRYYYGVREGEATTSRPAYSPGAALNVAAGVAGRYAISRRWGAFLSINHTWLDDAVADSPIVGRDRRWSGIAAVTYTFR